MNKTEMANKLAEKADISKAQAAEIIDLIFSTRPDKGIIASELEAGHKVTITGFGSFSCKRRAERHGRNPATGQTITIPAKNYAHFSAHQGLMDYLSGGLEAIAGQVRIRPDPAAPDRIMESTVAPELIHIDTEEPPFVGLSASAAELDFEDLTWIDSSVLEGDLAILGASREVRAQVATLAQKRRLSAAALEELAGVITGLRRAGDWGEIVDRQRIDWPLPVVAAGAPDSQGAMSTGSYTFTHSEGGGLSLKIAGIGVERSVEYTISRGLKITCDAAEAKLASVLVPLDMIRQRYRPPGGQEWLNVVRYEPVPDQPTGGEANMASVEELLEAAGTEAPEPLRGNTSFAGNQSREVAVSDTIEIAAKAASSTSLTVSARLSGKVNIKYEYELPPGQFRLYWLKRPAGACILSNS